MRFDHYFIKEAVPHIVFIHTEYPDEYNFSIDSRTVNPGDIFIALEGSRTDGHQFVGQALSNGAAGIMINESRRSLLNSLDPRILEKKLVMAVTCTRQALIALASAWRNKFTIPIIGITGSVGKTSTKELISSLLHRAGIAHVASHGTQNTKIGCALNLLRIRDEHKIALFEMGINKRGEMAALAHLVRPTTAIITNVGHSHMEGLGSLHDIAIEKRDIFKYFGEDSIGIINGDIPFLSGVAYAHPVIKFGSKTINQIQARKITISSEGITFILKLYKEKYTIRLNKNHEGAVFNALAATAVAHLLGVPAKIIIDAIQEQPLVPGRFEKRLLRSGMGTLINDCYNANPESVKAALLAFEKLKTTGQKIVILGDMLELGVNSPFWHRQIGRFLRKVPSVKHLILVGDLVKWTRKTVPVGMTTELVPSWQEAIQKLQEKVHTESCVLVKGSLGMQLINVVEACSVSE